MRNGLSKHLAWFLGPKAEQSALVENLIVTIIRDYFHWRKNYFPGDPILLDSITQRSLAPEHDQLNQAVDELMAQLRRNFPFYSPRYIAHQLSDTLIPSTVGYLAGMLFNPNNITPEAAPVTTELEIEACNSILKMLGFRSPPNPPPTSDLKKIIDYYEKQNQREYGWAHLTSGGTVANIEALWIARQVKYFPLAIQDVAKREGLEIQIKLPFTAPGTQPIPKVDIASVEPYRVTVLKSNESIYLLSKFFESLMRSGKVFNDIEKNFEKNAWSLLNKSKYSLSNGLGLCISEFPPRIFIAGTRHYSLSKAVNILGLGDNNIVPIKTDEYFRMDIADLERQIIKSIKEKCVPLCVVATAGTTEEGAVDPIDGILDLRMKIEREYNASFWLHIDAAWGGFFRSLFNLQPVDRASAVSLKVSRVLGIESDLDIERWHSKVLIPAVRELFKDNQSPGIIVPVEAKQSNEIIVPELKQLEVTDLVNHSDGNTTVKRLTADSPADSVVDIRPRKIQREIDNQTIYRPEQKTLRELIAMEKTINDGEYEAYVRQLLELPKRLAARLPGFKDKSQDVKNNAQGSKSKNDNRLTESDILQWLSNYVSDEIDVQGESGSKVLTINWPKREVAKAFLAFPAADSITVDPHKMGFQHYPSGCIAFKNDLVRLFIWQNAPYITSKTQNSMIHFPPRHASIDPLSKTKIDIDSFSPFILEGSRPGAAAAALWLSTRVVPLQPREHGSIIKESILASRSLYEWLRRWNELNDSTDEGLDYQFICLTPGPPDTNIVIFVIKKKTSNSLRVMNQLTKKVYEKFTIQSELGEREYSYSQPFFISNTTFTNKEYPLQTIASFLDRCQLSKQSHRQYAHEGIAVLRASVMNPYINVARKGPGGQDYVRLFVEELGRAAQHDSSKLASK